MARHRLGPSSGRGGHSSRHDRVATLPSMTRRADPERIYQARRAATFAILTQTRAIDELDAEHWMVRWEREAAANGPAMGSQGYWDAAWRWIAENRRKH